MMKTVAELKRKLVPGTKLRMTKSYGNPVDFERTVIRTTASYLILSPFPGKTDESRLGWPAAKDLDFEPNGFSVYESYVSHGSNGDVPVHQHCLTYEFVED